MKVVNVATQFSDYLVNRNQHQGDGTFSAVDFRERFLQDLESDDWWGSAEYITLDFDGVEILGPSWANEVFAYYTSRNKSPEEILKKIRILNLKSVKLNIVQDELRTGYSG